MLAHALVGPPSRGLPQRWKPVVRSRVDRRLRSSRRQIPVCRYFRWSVLAMGIPRDFRFCIDRGGTFTDVYAEVPAQDAEGNTSVSFRTLKLLSEDPANYESAPREGIRRILEEVTGTSIPRDVPVPTDRIEWIRMGTTVATNALLEREGARSALVVTEGFRDLLAIGNQARPDIFDLEIKRPSRLYERVVEAQERVRVRHTSEEDSSPSESAPNQNRDRGDGRGDRDRASTRRGVAPPTASGVARRGDRLARGGADALVRVSRPRKRRRGTSAIDGLQPGQPVLGARADGSRRAPRTHRERRRVPHAVHPYVPRHVPTRFRRRFERTRGTQGELHAIRRRPHPGGTLHRLQGDPLRSRGRCGGYARTTRAETESPVIGFDMGGTSTDVSRFDGAYEQVTETETAGGDGAGAAAGRQHRRRGGRIEAHVQVRDVQGRPGVRRVPARARVLQERRYEPVGDGRQLDAGAGPPRVLPKDLRRRTRTSHWTPVPRDPCSKRRLRRSTRRWVWSARHGR